MTTDTSCTADCSTDVKTTDVVSDECGKSVTWVDDDIGDRTNCNFSWVTGDDNGWKKNDDGTISMTF